MKSLAWLYIYAITALLRCTVVSDAALGLRNHVCFIYYYFLRWLTCNLSHHMLRIVGCRSGTSLYCTTSSSSANICTDTMAPYARW